MRFLSNLFRHGRQDKEQEQRAGSGPDAGAASPSARPENVPQPAPENEKAQTEREPDRKQEKNLTGETGRDQEEKPSGKIDHKRAMELEGEVVIPECMDEIDGALFDGNKGITSVIVPGTVKRIGSRAFAECENLEKIVLNEGIEAIGSNVFTGCGKLKRVTYPDSVKTYQGWTFWRTNLEAPVLNTSGTILVFCPEAVSGKEWTVPDTVKIISWQAFIKNRELEILHLPEGLEKIEKMAFIECGLRRITIPRSVREIGEEAFYNCEQLEEVNILNPETKIGPGVFAECKNIKKINYGNLKESDRIFHLKGEPFLIQHVENPANLGHASNPEFKRLAALCAQGDADAMSALADWFEQWSHKPDASPFYIRAANYWRYRAYRGGNAGAAEWFERYFAEHPGQHLESVLSENSNHRIGYYSHSVPGRILNDLGFDFFDPEKQYEIKQLEGEDLVEASAFESYEGPDEDGFGAEYYYDWWFLDENMQPIPGIQRVNAMVREISGSYFQKTRGRAIEILRKRRNAKERRLTKEAGRNVPVSRL